MQHENQRCVAGSLSALGAAPSGSVSGETYPTLRQETFVEL